MGLSSKNPIIGSYDTLAGRTMRVDIKNGDIFIGSLTGNIFRWYPGWVEGISETAPGFVK